MTRIPLPDDVVAKLRKMHEEGDRGYHGWSHPVDLLEKIHTISGLLHDVLAMRCAAITHDVIYDVSRKDNEVRSAQFARGLLQGLIPEVSMIRMTSMTEATAGHYVQEGLSPEDTSDTKHFLDLDLSILGEDREKFDRYEAGIRHEYRAPPLHEYAAARAKVMSTFLERPRIYVSEWGRDMYEARARRNLKGLIARLTRIAEEGP